MDVVGKPTDSRRNTKNLIIAGRLGGDDVTVASGWGGDGVTAAGGLGGDDVTAAGGWRR